MFGFCRGLLLCVLFLQCPCLSKVSFQLAMAPSITVDSLSVVLYDCCCLEREICTTTVSLQHPEDDRPTSNEQKQVVRAVLDEFSVKNLTGYWFHASKDGEWWTAWSSPSSPVMCMDLKKEGTVTYLVHFCRQQKQPLSQVKGWSHIGSLPQALRDPGSHPCVQAVGGCSTSWHVRLVFRRFSAHDCESFILDNYTLLYFLTCQDDIYLHVADWYCHVGFIAGVEMEAEAKLFYTWFLQVSMNFRLVDWKIKTYVSPQSQWPWQYFTVVEEVLVPVSLKMQSSSRKILGGYSHSTHRWIRTNCLTQ